MAFFQRGSTVTLAALRPVAATCGTLCDGYRLGQAFRSSSNSTTSHSSGGPGKPTAAPDPKAAQGPRVDPKLSTKGPAGPDVQSQDYTLVLKLAQKLAVPDGPGIEPAQVGYVSGLREVGMAPRRVLIYSAARSPEQQGRQRTAFNRNCPAWGVEFLDPVERWINPLMGWTSTADTMDQTAAHLQFYSPEEAIAFCERQGYLYEVQQPNEPRPGRPSRRWATYGDNFSVRRHGLPDLDHLPSNRSGGTAGGIGGAGEGGDVGGDAPSGRAGPSAGGGGGSSN